MSISGSVNCTPYPFSITMLWVLDIHGNLCTDLLLNYCEQFKKGVLLVGRKPGPPLLVLKGQIKSEWIYEIINFPKYEPRQLKDYCPMYYWAKILQIFRFILRKLMISCIHSDLIWPLGSPSRVAVHTFTTYLNSQVFISQLFWDFFLWIWTACPLAPPRRT